MIIREETTKVLVKGVQIGNQNKVVIQSMTSTKTKDIKATTFQINSLATLGSEIVRLAILDVEDANAILEIKKNVSVPLVADIHFDYKLALLAIENGIDKIRINPGNIGSIDKIKAVVDACNKKGIPIRIGVNGGSLEKHILAKYKKPSALAMVASAKYHVAILEDLGFTNIIISLKSSNIRETVEAYRLASKTFKYPLHIGITEAGTLFGGTIKSSIGLGILLYEGIGDTMRVSLSTDPLEEIKVAKEMLSALDLYDKPKIISCPTCGRLSYDMFPILDKIEAYLETIDENITVAVMGCAVNGPGEARSADIGVAGGNGEGLIFVEGKIVKKVKEEELYDSLIVEINEYIKKHRN
ncbi:MAG: flavodoxin-dependent (E)-4-hydroxy-3-methylbut-2-enyl-diphosphate synthase [Candidatus Izemoplasma sp.]